MRDLRGFGTIAAVVLALVAGAVGCSGDEPVVDPAFELMDVIAYDAAGFGVPSDGAGGDIYLQDVGAQVGDTAPSQPVVSFSRRYGGSYGDEFHAVQRIGLDVYAAGFTQSFGSGEKDALLVRVDACGKLSWGRAFGGKAVDEAMAISAVGTQLWLAGRTESFGAGSQAWAWRVTPSGGITASVMFGGEGYDEATAVVALDDGGAMIAGNSASYGAAAPDSKSAMVLRVDKAGKLQWGRAYGKKYSSNTIYSAIALPNKGGFALAGRARSWGAGGDDFWLVRLDPLGKFQWASTYGSDQDEEARALTFAPDGGFLLAGQTEGFGAKGHDVMVVKVNGGGTVQWGLRVGSESGDEKGFAVMRMGVGYLVTGGGDDFGGGSNGVHVRLGPSGALQWLRSFGAKKSERGLGALQMADGSVISAGYSKTDATGQRDAWLTRTESSGGIGCSGEMVPGAAMTSVSIAPKFASMVVPPMEGIEAKTVQVKTTNAPDTFLYGNHCAGDACK